MGPDSESVDLLARATSGDRGAIEELLELHLPELQGFLARRAGDVIRAHESAADLAQSVCREALEHARDRRLRFLGEAQFKQWLYRAAVLKLMSRRRYWAVTGRADAAQALPLATDSSPVLARGETPSRDAMFLEELERFAQALAQLGPEQRQAITLHHLQGRSHAEIARELGTSEAYSRTLLSRALARLARRGAATPP